MIKDPLSYFFFGASELPIITSLVCCGMSLLVLGILETEFVEPVLLIFVPTGSIWLRDRVGAYCIRDKSHSFCQGAGWVWLLVVEDTMVSGELDLPADR